mmetsp:Transcript_18197/g.27018  ORF Transcript_18197/g.27018 Transcript_18197/m.27018 type:complete len:308 (+) Transcript_18197:1033-1956(+)
MGGDSFEVRVCVGWADVGCCFLETAVLRLLIDFSHKLSKRGFQRFTNGLFRGSIVQGRQCRCHETLRSTSLPNKTFITEHESKSMRRPDIVHRLLPSLQQDDTTSITQCLDSIGSKQNDFSLCDLRDGRDVLAYFGRFEFCILDLGNVHVETETMNTRIVFALPLAKLAEGKHGDVGSKILLRECLFRIKTITSVLFTPCGCEICYGSEDVAVGPCNNLFAFFAFKLFTKLGNCGTLSSSTQSTKNNDRSLRCSLIVTFSRSGLDLLNNLGGNCIWCLSQNIQLDVGFWYIVRINNTLGLGKVNALL